MASVDHDRDVTLLSESKPSGSASMLSCVLNLCNTIMGTGILALPYALAGTGTVLGGVFLALSGSACIFSLHLLCEAARTIGRPATFYSVCESAFPRLSLVVDLLIVFNGFLACETFLIVAGDSFSKLFEDGPSRQVWTLVSLGCVAPLSLLRRLDALKFTSALSVLVLLLISTIVILFSLGVDTPLLQPCGPHETSAQCHGPVASVGKPVGIVRSFATFVVAFTCQQNIFNCTNEMRDPTPRRCLMMICLAIGLATLLYGVVGYAGYATFGAFVQSDILETYPQGNDLVFVARLGMGLVVITCYPLQAYALRMSVGTLLDAVCQARCLSAAADTEPPTECTVPPESVASADAPSVAAADAPSAAIVTAIDEAAPPTSEAPSCGVLGRVFVLDSRSLGIVAALLVLNTALALNVSKLGIIVDINGSLNGTSITFIVPGLVYYLLHPGRRRGATGMLAVGVALLGVVIVPVSLVAAFLPAAAASANATAA